MTAKLFPVTTAGSWPRPPELVRARRRRQERLIGSKGFGEVAGVAVLKFVRCQEKAGADIVIDGEQRGDNFYQFVTDKPGGVKLTSVSDLLMYVPGRVWFEETLLALEVPAFAVKSAVAVGRLRERLRIRAIIKCRS